MSKSDRAWTKRCRLTSKNRKITCRLVDQVEMNRWLREQEIKAAPRDAERRVNDDNHQYPSAA